MCVRVSVCMCVCEGANKRERQKKDSVTDWAEAAV